MHTLTKLGNKLDNGKSSEHLYTEFYGPLLSPYQELYTDILEIGVHRGHSLLLWAEFFSNAKISGIENLLYHQNLGSEFLEDVLNNERINIHIGDAYQKSMVDGFTDRGEKFDFILDDGSHQPGDQLFMLNNYVDLLKEGGILLIEDVASMGIAYFVSDNFTGDKARLSIIDRRLNPTPRVAANPDKSIHDTNYDEIIILYM